ncbi:MAG: hypothetical protein ACI9S8_000943 [Chlamydiales bacterium]|jgi:hypothetical protein
MKNSMPISPSSSINNFGQSLTSLGKAAALYTIASSITPVSAECYCEEASNRNNDYLMMAGQVSLIFLATLHLGHLVKDIRRRNMPQKVIFVENRSVFLNGYDPSL